MAEGLSGHNELATHNYKISDVNQAFRCSSCFKYKCELEELTEELITMKKIIQLLQEDLNTCKCLKSARTSKSILNVYLLIPVLHYVLVSRKYPALIGFDICN